MNYLESVTTDDLRRLLDDVDGKKPALRVVVGINYKAGVSPTDIARWYGLSRTTVYNWLARLESLADESDPTVLVDARRPGRPPKLTESQRSTLLTALSAPPRRVGLDAGEWTPEVLQAHIASEFGVEFTVRHARNLLDELS